MKKIVVAIDGFSSTGKSTLARQLAEKLQYTYVDSGAMYRAITLYFIDHEVDLKNKEAVQKALEHILVL
ncbi:MAG TPA: (d)CMP kinase [Chitinophagaceae bacterium]|nr:(d)CMP kinase [Chitinophagaceae bacterium]